MTHTVPDSVHNTQKDAASNDALPRPNAGTGGATRTHDQRFRRTLPQADNSGHTPLYGVLTPNSSHVRVQPQTTLDVDTVPVNVPRLDPLAILQALIGGDARPLRHIKMQPPGSAQKYLFVKDAAGEHLPITDAALRAHIDGRATYGAPLTGSDGLSRALVIELDTDSRTGAQRVQQAAQAHGVAMVSVIVKGADGHDGSHNYALTVPCDPKRAAALARQIATEAGYPDAEVWPKGNGIRLPLGIHTHTGRRGDVLTAGGEILNADDPAELPACWAAFAALPLVVPPPLPKVEPKAATPRRITLGEQQAERLSLADARDRFNDQHSLESLLSEYGADEIRPGYYSCPFCEHTHEITLFISQQGRLFSYSNRCKLHTSKGWDAFGLYVKVAHNDDIKAALKAVNPPPPRTHQKPQEAPQSEAPEYLTPQDAERRKKDRERKKQARRDAAQSLRSDVEARMAADGELTPADKAVLEVLLKIAGERGWCRPSKERIAEMSGYSLGSVKRSLGRLEGRYFTSEGEGGGPNCTAVRTFLRGSSAVAEPSEMIHEYIYIASDTQPGELESAPQEAPPPPAEPQAAPVRRGMQFKELWQQSPDGLDALSSRMQWREDADEPDAADVAEQQQLVASVAPEPKAPAVSGRYQTLLNGMSLVELVNERAKQAGIYQHSLGKPYRKDVQRKLDAIDAQLVAMEAAHGPEVIDDVFLPMNGVPFDDDDWGACPALTSSPPEGRAAYDYPPGYVDEMIARFRAMKAPPAAAAE